MARESADIPHSMRKVYRRFVRWRSAHSPLADSGALGARWATLAVLVRMADRRECSDRKIVS